jgi:hypothetical protein
MCLDYILQRLGSKKTFLKNGKLSKSGIKAYELLVDIVYNLPLITDTISIEQSDKIVADLDKIEHEN